jgi:hypothetical protein
VVGAKEGFYGYEKTPVRSDSCALLATRFGSVSAEDLVARISHFAAPVSGTLVRVRCACAVFFFSPSSRVRFPTRTHAHRVFHTVLSNIPITLMCLSIVVLFLVIFPVLSPANLHEIFFFFFYGAVVRNVCTYTRPLPVHICLPPAAIKDIHPEG